MQSELQPIDHSTIRTSQVCLLILLILAFVLNAAWLVAILALILLAGVIRRRPAFDFIYTRLLKPRGWVKPEVLLDHAEPHRFSQVLAFVFISASALALYTGSAILGWGLAWMVVALAALNAFGGFCVGCAVYYWLNRLGVPGFRRAAPGGIFPGSRPKGHVHPSDQSAGGE
jgi:hypothetical protein